LGNIGWYCSLERNTVAIVCDGLNPNGNGLNLQERDKQSSTIERIASWQIGLSLDQRARGGVGVVN